MKKIFILLISIFSFSLYASSDDDIRDYNSDFLCEILNIDTCDPKDIHGFVKLYNSYIKSSWPYKFIVMSYDSKNRLFHNPVYKFAKDQNLGEQKQYSWMLNENSRINHLIGRCSNSFKLNINDKCKIVVKNNKIIDPDFLKQLLNSRKISKEKSLTNSTDLSPREKLRKLKYLLDEGLISQDQYEEDVTIILESY